MNIEQLSTIVALLGALSVASERLVEIVKSLVPFLDQANDMPKKEGQRRAALQTLAVLAGIGTTLLARPAIENIVSGPWNSVAGIVALGLLASGGSGVWNSVATYLTKVKDIKKLQVEAEKEKKTPPPTHGLAKAVGAP